MVPDVGAGWRSQPRGAPTFGVPWVGVPPHGRARVPSPRGGRAVGTSSDSVAVLQGTGTRGSDRRCHPDPQCHLHPTPVSPVPLLHTVWPLLGSLPGPRGSLLQGPLGLGLALWGCGPYGTGEVPPPQPWRTPTLSSPPQH